MLYTTYLLGGFSIGGCRFSSVFVLRNDARTSAGIFVKDSYEYTIKAAELMMKNGWFEEPPKMDV